jgi:hypothetical protein
MNLLGRIDKSKGHISRSAWMKEAAEFYLKDERRPAVKVNEDVGLNNEGIDGFLDSFN